MKYFLLANWILTFAGCGVAAGVLVQSFAGMPPDDKLFTWAIAIVVTPLAWAFGWERVWKLVKER